MTRIVLAALGVVVGGYGAVLLWDNPPVILVRIVVWALVAVVVHDLVFAPVCAALGWSSRRLVPVRWQAPVALAALCSVVLALLAIPVYGKPGLRPDNLSVLDRDYVRGLWWSLAVVWLCVPAYMGGKALKDVAFKRSRQPLPVGQDEVVERERACDIEPQPPTV
ncbi:hypothetical protein [Mycolicibacterium smegmatis]|nr:hypothetical protein [Mycolicibacterium smegmatis]AIU06252.1 hypothetical protein LJ00_04950 [Mycolicibacterium smegmatis MC2 155]AIU12877.1 hypothetical protein LI99_04950 [Mycolicibacterium smegmatis]AIU19501.1 hypothetical protein LI98_04950 [Mycolicibacterium smegmatis]MBE9618319.1 hypothetical protein [Mycolicibacterium smegmatis]MBE9624547.1 hypothetical protein [Mycolicibacterium smegmatis]